MLAQVMGPQIWPRQLLSNVRGKGGLIVPVIGSAIGIWTITAMTECAVCQLTRSPVSGVPIAALADAGFVFTPDRD